MSPIEAVFRHGVFQPLEPVDLLEEQRVQLSIMPATGRVEINWLEDVRALQEAVVRRVGILPDSARDIATDRLR